MIYNFAKEFKGLYRGFDGRRVKPLRAALLLVSHWEFTLIAPSDNKDWDAIKTGGATLGAMYLVALLEFLCRVTGRYLDYSGKIIRELPKQLREKTAISPDQKRVNRIDQAFAIYLYRNQAHLGKRLRTLDHRLQITRRLQNIRNPLMHGEAEDASTEPYFLALLVAMFYYSSTRN